MKLCKIGIHRNTSITACMTKHCLDCGKSLGHINEPKERELDDTDKFLINAEHHR